MKGEALMDPATMAALFAGVNSGMASQQMNLKIVKENASEALQVATMASSLPVNPNLGRNLNISA